MDAPGLLKSPKTESTPPYQDTSLGLLLLTIYWQVKSKTLSIVSMDVHNVHSDAPSSYVVRIC